MRFDLVIRQRNARMDVQIVVTRRLVKIFVMYS